MNKNIKEILQQITDIITENNLSYNDIDHLLLDIKHSMQIKEFEYCLHEAMTKCLSTSDINCRQNF